MLDAATAMHWYSDGRVFERPWDEVFALGVTAARALGSRPEEARLLNFLGWARHICLGDNEAGLVTHRQALLVAVEARRGRTPTSVRYCCASAVPRKRSNTPGSPARCAVGWASGRPRYPCATGWAGSFRDWAATTKR